MEIISGGPDVYSRLQEINKIAADRIKKEVEKECPNFEKDVNRIWEVIEEFLYGEEEELDRKKELELKEKLNSIHSSINRLKISSSKVQIEFSEQKRDYCTLFHYADLYGLDPYFLNDEPLKTKQKDSSEDFVESIVSNVKRTKSSLKRVELSEEEEKLHAEISELKKKIGELEKDSELFDLYGSELNDRSERLFALKKKKANFRRNLDELLLKLEAADLRKAETPVQLLEHSKSTIPSLEPLEEDEFERIDVKFGDPSSDDKFNEEIYEYASDGKIIEDAPVISWIESSNSSKPLPRDILNRLKDSEDYSVWEYSSVYSKEDDDDRRLCLQFRNHLTTVFGESGLDKVFKVRDGDFSEEATQDFRERYECGEVNIEVDKMLQISPVFNPFYFIPVRDEKSGEILDYNVGLKSFERREREASMRGEIKYWMKDSPRVTFYGWKSPKIQDDEDNDDALDSKPKEKNVKNEDMEAIREDVLKLCGSLEEVVAEEVTPSMVKAREMLDSFGLKTSRIPFESLDELLRSVSLDFDSRQNYRDLNPDAKVKSQKWIEEAIEENFENIDIASNEPMPLVNAKSIFQETLSQFEESDEQPQEKVAQKAFTEKTSEFLMGSDRCEEENKKLIEEYESVHGSSSRGAIFSQTPDEKHEEVDLENTLESYEAKYLTYPYYSTDVFQPDALLVRRLIRKIDGYESLATAKPDISLDQQKEILKNVKNDSDSSLFEFENKKDPAEAYLKFRTIQKAIESGQKMVDDFFNVEDIEDESGEIDFDFGDFENPVRSSTLKVEPFEFDPENLLEGMDFDSDCGELEEGDDYALKTLENIYESAKLSEFGDWSEDSDEEAENTFTWAPLKPGEKFDAENLILKSLSLLDYENVNYGQKRREKFKKWIRENDEMDADKLSRFVSDSAKVNPHFFDAFDRVCKSIESDEDDDVEEEAMKKPVSQNVGNVFKEMGRAEANSEIVEISKNLQNKKLIKNEFIEEVDTQLPVDISTIEMAHQYSFELDNFQKAAILALERENHVFVSAHTSAGKTVVAEYAIAMARRNETRVIYTSPIKALSNQKFYDFKKKFDCGENGISVGLITGDVQVNEDAKCLIMTTEILRSMIFNCPDKISDLEFVIFDEVHYLNDPERGHVWEECIILLSERVKIIMLSATVPNARQFSSWIGMTKKRKVTICSTRFRPVPLQHYLLWFSPQGISGEISEISTLVKDGEKPLIQSKFEEHRKKRDTKQKEKAKDTKNFKHPPKKNEKINSAGSEGERKANNPTDRCWTSLIKTLEAGDKLPAVIFVFSRKKCDEFASRCAVDLTDATEKAKIQRFFDTHISSKLDSGDRQLPQIQEMKKLLLKGIGVHHSGILPMLKEIVECLFGESVVKVLFATETFAMGVNMPARTVVFNRIEKYDKSGNRYLETDEYIQMAGRAGRRGKDKVGYVYILDHKHKELKNEIEFSTLRSVMEGQPRALSSQFKIFYRTILNLFLKREHFSIKMLMDKSFLKNETKPKETNLEEEYQRSLSTCKNLKDSLDSYVLDKEVKAYSEFYGKITNYLDERLNDQDFAKSIEAGRLVRFTRSDDVNRIGVVLSRFLHQSDQFFSVFVFERKSNGFAPKLNAGSDLWYKMISFFPFTEAEFLGSESSFKIINIQLCDVFELFETRIKKLDAIEVNDYIKKNKITRSGTKMPEFLLDFMSRAYHLIQGISKSRMINKLYLSGETKTEIDSVNSLENFDRFYAWLCQQNRVNNLRNEMSEDCNDQTFMSKKDVLYALHFISNDKVLVKGHIAARISKFEVIISEILVDNILADLDPCEIASLLSCFVYEKRLDEGVIDFEDLPIKLLEAIKSVDMICKKVVDTEKHNSVPQTDGYESEKISFKICNIVYLWAQGVHFSEILALPEAAEFQEGIIVRFIIQLTEVLKEVEAAAKIMADRTISEKIQAASKVIKRGIVFTPSLYVDLGKSSETRDKK